MNRIAPIQAMRDNLLRFAESLDDVERLVFPYIYDLWLRPEQRFPTHDWRWVGFTAGRGWGKTETIAIEINRRVERGEVSHVALMAPTEKRAHAVQIKALIDTAPPWFKPWRYLNGLMWPNGVRAIVFTPEAPERPRSENIALAWCCELVDWPYNTRKDAWENMCTATRIGCAQLIWDSTSKGRNDLILSLEAEHAANPHTYVIRRGTTFENPMLSRKYVKDVCARYVIGTRRYREEILGEHFAESGGALWQQRWLDEHRVQIVPTDLEIKLVGLDTALSDHRDADETGIIVAGRKGKHIYVSDDFTGRYKPDAYCDIAVRECEYNGCAGVVAERIAGDHIEVLLRSRAAARGMTVHMLREGQIFPRRQPGRIYLREVKARESKSVRAAGPASETERGLVHIVGTLPELEYEFTTWEPGGKSPNRYDAAVHVINELSGLMREHTNDPEIGVVQAFEATREINLQLARLADTRRIGM